MDQHVARRLRPFGTTVFTEINVLAAEHNVVNLSQGFPDFDAPDFLKDAAADAMAAGRNQYARSFGEPILTGAIAAAWRRSTGHEIDPETSVTVTSGCTEALAACFIGLLDPGDEVILFEPYYDSYRAGVAMGGGTPRFVALRPEGGRFVLDEAELRAAFTSKTRALVLNTPHNPTGKVFSREELALIARLCVEHGVIVIADEVYERLTYGPAHVSIATLPGMAERTITCSSLGKTFSATGWKIGWAIAPPPLSRVVRSAHQFLTFATATPLQHAAAVALDSGENYVRDLVSAYARARDYLCENLARIGFSVHVPDGTYFVIADHSRFEFENDVDCCRRLIWEFGVAAIPPTAFYERKELGRAYVRFAFCKRMETLEEAVRRLEPLAARVPLT
jgi:aspartate/methionine/tyrosine aminotransferase